MVYLQQGGFVFFCLGGKYFLFSFFYLGWKLVFIYVFFLNLGWKLFSYLGGNLLLFRGELLFVGVWTFCVSGGTIFSEEGFSFGGEYVFCFFG